MWAYLYQVSMLAADAPGTSPGSGAATANFLSSLGSLSWLFNLGAGGALAFMAYKRVLVMPIGEYTDAKAEWEKERVRLEKLVDDTKATAERNARDSKAQCDRERTRLEKDLDDVQATNASLTNTIIEQVVPAVTLVAGPLNELVKLKQPVSKRRGNDI